MSGSNLPPTESPNSGHTPGEGTAKAAAAGQKPKIGEEKVKDVVKGDKQSLKRELIGMALGFPIVFLIFSWGASQPARSFIQLILIIALAWYLIKAILQYKGKL